MERQTPKNEVKRMEEKNITSPNETKDVKKSTPTPKQSKGNDGNEKNGFADYKAEFKKIVWPSRMEIVKSTTTVIVTSLIVGVIITCMDTVFSTGYDALINLLG